MTRGKMGDIRNQLRIPRRKGKGEGERRGKLQLVPAGWKSGPACKGKTYHANINV